jgi:anti-anti-sigma factor
MSLAIEIYKSDGGKCRIELKGRLDTNTAAEFDEKAASVDHKEYPIQVVDLAGLDYVSSAGVRSLFKARKNAHDAGGQLLLVHPQPQVKKVFDIIKALPSTSIFASQEEMDAYLDAMQRKSST